MKVRRFACGHSEVLQEGGTRGPLPTAPSGEQHLQAVFTPPSVTEVHLGERREILSEAHDQVPTYRDKNPQESRRQGYKRKLLHRHGVCSQTRVHLKNPKKKIGKAL